MSNGLKKDSICPEPGIAPFEAVPRKKKTVMDCTKEDIEDMNNIQKVIDLLIGHENNGLEEELYCYYRKRKIGIKLLGKLE